MLMVPSMQELERTWIFKRGRTQEGLNLRTCKEWEQRSSPLSCNVVATLCMHALNGRCKAFPLQLLGMSTSRACVLVVTVLWTRQQKSPFHTAVLRSTDLSNHDDKKHLLGFYYMNDLFVWLGICIFKAILCNGKCFWVTQSTWPLAQWERVMSECIRRSPVCVMLMAYVPQSIIFDHALSLHDFFIQQ